MWCDVSRPYSQNMHASAWSRPRRAKRLAVQQWSRLASQNQNLTFWGAQVCHVHPGQTSDGAMECGQVEGFSGTDADASPVPNEAVRTSVRYTVSREHLREMYWTSSVMAREPGRSRAQACSWSASATGPQCDACGDTSVQSCRWHC
jgi:hypothetical protein